MHISSLHCSSNLDKFPLSRKPTAAEVIYFCPCLTNLPAFPLPRGYRPLPHFGSVVQPSKSRVDNDFRADLSGFCPVCSQKPLRIEIIQPLWANCSTPCLSSWCKSLSRYLTLSSVNLIQPPSSLHSP